MPEPLTDEQLKGFASIPDILRATRPYAATCIQRLLDEVERLRAERAAFVALADAVTKDRNSPEEWLADRLWLRQLARDAMIPKEAL